jgi:hypothetical protein
LKTIELCHHHPLWRNTGNQKLAKLAGIPPQQAKIGLTGNPGCQRLPKLKSKSLEADCAIQCPRPANFRFSDFSTRSRSQALAYRVSFLSSPSMLILGAPVNGPADVVNRT